MAVSMGQRAEPSGIYLSEADAGIVKGMLACGDRQHDIAAWFGVNGGRIAEVATGRRFRWVPMATNDLPPPGPYPSGRRAAEAERALEAALCALCKAESAIRKLGRAA
jgi:hypothetical protein